MRELTIILILLTVPIRTEGRREAKETVTKFRVEKKLEDFNSEIQEMILYLEQEQNNSQEHS